MCVVLFMFLELSPRKSKISYLLEDGKKLRDLLFALASHNLSKMHNVY